MDWVLIPFSHVVMGWVDYLESCTSPEKALTSSPFIKTQQSLCFPDTLSTNTTMPTTTPHTHTHALPPYSPPFLPFWNTKLPVVAMATAGVHKSKLTGILFPQNYHDDFWGAQGGGGGDPQDGWRIWMKGGRGDRVGEAGGDAHPSLPPRSRWCHVALPCHRSRLLRTAAIRRQVSRRFGVTVFGMGYKEGREKILGALAWHTGKLPLCSCLWDLVPMLCNKWKAKVFFMLRVPAPHHAVTFSFWWQTTSMVMELSDQRLRMHLLTYF